MNSITTHILDTSSGRPAANVPVRLERKDEGGGFVCIGQGVTDGDGRLRTLMNDTPLVEGIYRLVFDTEAYFDQKGTVGFYPEASVAFRVRNTNEHYHVPLLLNPFGYSTYRGS